MEHNPRGDDSSRVVWLVVGAVAAVFVVCAGVVGVGVVYFGLTRTQSASFTSVAPPAAIVATTPTPVTHDAEEACTNFFRQLELGYREAAYALTTAGFKKRQSLEKFNALLDEHPALTNRQSISLMTERSDAKAATVQVPVVGADGSVVVVTVVLVHDGKRWMVDGLSIR